MSKREREYKNEGKQDKHHHQKSILSSLSKPILSTYEYPRKNTKKTACPACPPNPLFFLLFIACLHEECVGSWLVFCKNNPRPHTLFMQIHFINEIYHQSIKNKNNKDGQAGQEREIVKVIGRDVVRVSIVVDVAGNCGGGVVSEVRLVERDYRIFREAERWRVVLGRHLAELAGFTGLKACQRRLKKLIEAGKNKQ